MLLSKMTWFVTIVTKGETEQKMRPSRILHEALPGSRSHVNLWTDAAWSSVI